MPTNPMGSAGSLGDDAIYMPPKVRGKPGLDERRTCQLVSREMPVTIKRMPGGLRDRGVL